MTGPKITLAAILLAGSTFLAPIPAAAFDAQIDAMLQSWKNENEVIGDPDGPVIPSTESPNATERFNNRLQGLATTRTSTRGTAPRPAATNASASQAGERRTIQVGDLIVDRKLAPELDMDAAADGIVALREPSGGTASTSSSAASTSSRSSGTNRTPKPPTLPAAPSQDIAEGEDEEVSSTGLALYDEEGLPMDSVEAEEPQVAASAAPTRTASVSPTASTKPAAATGSTRSSGTASQAQTATQAATTRSGARTTISSTAAAAQKIKLYDEDGNLIGEVSLNLPDSKSGASPASGTRRSVASVAPSEEDAELAY